MAGLTDTWETSVGNWLLRGQAAPTVGATVYVALYTSDPTDTGGAGAEVVGGSYARQAVVFAAPVTAGLFVSSADVVLPTATANWGTVGWVGYHYADSGGTPFAVAHLVDASDVETTKTINSGDTLTLPAGRLKIAVE